jgi:hypothetical protein
MLALNPTGLNYMIVLEELHKVNEGKTFFFPSGPGA